MAPDPGLITKLTAMPLALPERLILSRLGFHHHLTVWDEAQKRRIAQQMRRAFALCRAAGRYRVLPIATNDGVTITLADGRQLASEKLAALVGNATMLWVAAVTLGDAIAARIADCGDDIAEAAVIDAVGSECADEAINFLQEYARTQLRRQNLVLAARRFSPGYGGLALTAQKDIFEWLQLEELGLHLNAAFLMTPEKSVTAVAGVAAKERE